MPPDRDALEQRYLHLTRTALPAAARERRWPIRHDHCFMRLILDHLFEDCWYPHLDRTRPAYKQLTAAQLAQAITLAERMLTADADEVAAMNHRSLSWRGKGS